MWSRGVSRKKKGVVDAEIRTGINETTIRITQCVVLTLEHESFTTMALQVKMRVSSTKEARTGHDRTGQDSTGQNRTGQDRTGQARSGWDRRG